MRPDPFHLGKPEQALRTAISLGQPSQLGDSEESIMHRRLAVNTDIRIDDGCTIKHSVQGSGRTELVVSDTEEVVGFTIESEALRELVQVGTTALREMDRLYAEEQGTPKSV